MKENKSPKVRNKVVKTALLATVHEYRNSGWSQQRIANHLGYSRSYIRKILGTEVGAKGTEVNRAKVPTNGQTTAEENGNPVPELERVMTAVQSECRKLVKLEKEEIRHQILEDLQLERRLFLNAILLMGATPKTVLNAPQTRQVQQFITSLQQISCVLHKNTQALLKIYGLDAENNADLDIFNIDFLAAARKAGLKETKFDSRKLPPESSQ